MRSELTSGAGKSSTSSREPMSAQSLTEARQIADAVRTGRVGALEAAARSLDALHGAQERLHASITVLEELPDGRGHLDGPLAGVPVLVKDLIDTEGMLTTRGSRIFERRIPRASAESVLRLQRAGAIVIGKANLHEFAWGLTSRNPWWGDVRNPRNPELTPGGSSGGNAAAVAAGLVPVGLGTDTAGSLRIPALCCGVVGFKPSNGSVPTDGVFPLAPSLDCVGPITSTVADAALLFSVLAAQSPIVVNPGQLRVAATSPALRDLLHEAGINARIVEPPAPPQACEVIMPAEAYRTHRDLVARHADLYDPNVLSKLRAAASIDPNDYRRGLGAMRAWRQELVRRSEYDVLVDLTCDIAIPPADVEELAVREQFGRRTRWANIAGWAALALGPVQVLGAANWEVLAVAGRLEPVLTAASGEVVP